MGNIRLMNTLGGAIAWLGTLVLSPSIALPPTPEAQSQRQQLSQPIPAKVPAKVALLLPLKRPLTVASTSLQPAPMPDSAAIPKFAVPPDLDQLLSPPVIPQTHLNLPEIRAIAPPSPTGAAILAQATQPATPTDNKPLEIQLADVVALVLANNRDIKNSYLERIAQRQDLQVSEQQFTPTVTPTLSIAGTRTDGESGLDQANLSTEVNWRSPIGTSILVRLDPTQSNYEITLKQPLLRGAGRAVNTASLAIARLTEAGNIQALRGQLIDTITTAIVAYRSLLEAQEQVKIQQLSLENARQSLAVNQALVQVGRLARVELLQNQADIASREVALVGAQNSLDAAKLNLLKLLDLDPGVALVVPPIQDLPPAIALDAAALTEFAFTHRPDYLQAKLILDRSQYDIVQAEDDRRWNLDLNATGRTGNNPSQVSASLVLTKTFPDFPAQRNVTRSQISRLQAENRLAALTTDLRIDIVNKIREIELQRQQITLARQATTLAEQTLTSAQERLRSGRSSSFEVIQLQGNVNQARNAELAVAIAYLNALTDLDQMIGRTLDTWNIQVQTD